MKDKDRKLVLVASVYPPEDIFIKGALENAGIPVLTSRESIAEVSGIAFGPLAEVKIYVPEEQEWEAREILSAAANDQHDDFS